MTLLQVVQVASNQTLRSGRSDSYSSSMTTFAIDGRQNDSTDSSIERRTFTYAEVAPEVGAKGLSVLARSPVGWDEAHSK